MGGLAVKPLLDDRPGKALLHEHRGFRRTANGQAEKLELNLYSVVHKMYKARNNVAHTPNENGIKLKEARDVKLAIEGTHAEDRHIL